MRMALKTGSAQYKAGRAMKAHALMVGFAPYETPRYAVSIIIEDGESGSGCISHRMRELMAGIRDLETHEESPNAIAAFSPVVPDVTR